MGYVRDAWSVIRGRPVVNADVESGSVLDLLLALEKRAATTTVAGSLSGRSAQVGVDLQTLLGRTTDGVVSATNLAAIDTVVDSYFGERTSGNGERVARPCSRWCY